MKSFSFEPLAITSIVLLSI